MALRLINDGDTANAADINQYRDLYRGGAVFDVKNGYGAVGNGITDDLSAIQGALDAAHAAEGGMVFFPAGVYYVSQPLTVYAGTHLVGVGPAGQQFVDDGTQGSVLLGGLDSGIITTEGIDIVGGDPDVSGRKEFYSFTGLRFKNGDAASAGTNILVDIRYAYEVRFENCVFDGSSRGGTLGLRLYNSGHVAVRKCNFRDFPAHTTASYTRPGLELCPTPSSFTGGFPVQLFTFEDLVFSYCDRAIDIGNRFDPTNDGIHTVKINGIFCKKSGMAGETNIALATSSATDDIIDTGSAHGLTAGQAVHFASLTGGAGLSLRTTYYVSATSLGTTTFRVSATNGGADLGFTTDITAGVVVKQTDTTATDISTGIACAATVSNLSISDCKFEDISAPIVVRADNARVNNIFADHAGTAVDVRESKNVVIDNLTLSSYTANPISTGVHFASDNSGECKLLSFRLYGTYATTTKPLINEAGRYGEPLFLGTDTGVGVASGATVNTANRMYIMPATLRQAMTVDAMQCYVVSGTTGTFKLAIYDSNYNLLANTAAQTDVVGRINAALVTPVTLAPGLYFLGIVSDNNTTTYGTAGGSGGLGLGHAQYEASAFTPPATLTPDGIASSTFVVTATPPMSYV